MKEIKTVCQNGQLHHHRNVRLRISVKIHLVLLDKYCLISLMIDFLQSERISFPKEIYVTNGNRCSPVSFNTSSTITEVPQFKSNQWEADTRIVFYATFSPPTQARRWSHNLHFVAQCILENVKCIFSKRW